MSSSFSESPEESCHNYSMQSVADEEEEESGKASQMVINSLGGKLVFVDESARSGELGLVTSSSERISDYKPYTKQESVMSEGASQLDVKNEVVSVQCDSSQRSSSAVQESSSAIHKQDSNPPTINFASEMQSLLQLKSAPVKRQRENEEEERSYKKLALEWKEKYERSEEELQAAREEIVTLKNDNGHLQKQVHMLQQMREKAGPETEAADHHPRLRLRSQTRNKANH